MLTLRALTMMLLQENNEYAAYNTLLKAADGQLQYLVLVEGIASRNWAEVDNVIRLYRQQKESLQGGGVGAGGMDGDEIGEAKEGAQPRVTVSLEEFKQKCIRAADSIFVDSEISASLQQFNQETRDFADECKTQLPTITDAQRDMSAISDLYKRSYQYPLPRVLLDKLESRYRACQVVNECQAILAQGGQNSEGQQIWSSFSMSDLIDLRKKHNMYQELVKATQSKRNNPAAAVITLAPVHIDEAILTSIWDTFQLYYWRREIDILTQQPAAKAHVEGLSELGQKLSAQVKFPESWSTLVGMLEAFYKVSAEAVSALNELDEAVVATNTAVKESLGIGATVTSLEIASKLTDAGPRSDQHITAFTKGSAVWSQSVSATLLTRLIELQNTLDTQSKVVDLTLSHRLEDARRTIQRTHEASKKVADLHRALNNPSDHTAHHVLDFKELTGLVNEFNNLTEVNTEFLLAKLISGMLLDFLNLATTWNETAHRYLTTKVATRKSKHSKASVIDGSKPLSHADVEDLANQPICRAINLPKYRDILTLLTRTQRLKEQTLQFFEVGTVGAAVTVDSDAMIIEGEEPSKETPVQVTLKDLTNIEEVNNAIKTIDKILASMDTLPFELTEAKVLQWFQAVLQWIANLPPAYLAHLEAEQRSKVSTASLLIQPEHTPVHILTYEQAKIHCDQGNAVLGQMPTYVEQWCYDKNVLVEDDSGDAYFQEDVTPYLLRSQEMIGELNQWRKQAQGLQSEIRAAVTGSMGNYQQLLERVANSPVMIDTDLKRALDSAYSKSRLSRPPPPMPPGKKARISVAEEEVHVSKKKAVKQKCLNQSCSHTIMTDSFYCSSKCAITNASNLYRDLVQYRQLLTSDTELPKSILSNTLLTDTIKADRAMFTVPSVNTVELFSLASKELSRRRLVAHSLAYEAKHAKALLGDSNTLNDSLTEVSGEDEKGPGNVLEALLAGGERYLHRIEMEAGAKSTDSLALDIPLGQAASSDFTKATAIDAMLATLPLSSAAFIQQAASTESPSPRTTTTTQTQKNQASASSAHTANPTEQTHEMREKIRFSFEDVFTTALLRKHVPGALCLAAILAQELEQELYLKYDSFSVITLAYFTMYTMSYYAIPRLIRI